MTFFGALAVAVVLCIIGVVGAIFGARTREWVLRDNSEEGSPYRSPEKLKELRAVPLKDLLKGIPYAGLKLVGLIALACALSFAVGERGHTVRTVGDALINTVAGTDTDSIEMIYFESQLNGEVSQESRERLGGIEPRYLLAWLSEYETNINADYLLDSDYREIGTTGRMRLLYGTIHRRNRTEDTVSLARHVRENGWLRREHCTDDGFGLAVVSLMALRQTWPISQQAFDAVRAEAMANNRSCWLSLNDMEFDDYRQAALEVLVHWRGQHQEQFDVMLRRSLYGEEPQPPRPAATSNSRAMQPRTPFPYLMEPDVPFLPSF